MGAAVAAAAMALVAGAFAAMAWLP